MEYQHPSAGGGWAHFMEGVDIFLNSCIYFVAMVHGLQMTILWIIVMLQWFHSFLLIGHKLLLIKKRNKQQNKTKKQIPSIPFHFLFLSLSQFYSWPQHHSRGKFHTPLGAFKAASSQSANSGFQVILPWISEVSMFVCVLCENSLSMIYFYICVSNYDCSIW